MSGEPSDEELARMRVSAEAWAQASGDWSEEQWKAVNASLRLGAVRALKKQAGSKKRKRKSAGPPTKPE